VTGVVLSGMVTFDPAVSRAAVPRAQATHLLIL
jgi:hypothetical protein